MSAVRRGVGVYPVRTFFGQRGRGSSNADVRTFGAKTFEFFENFGVSSRTRREGVEPVTTFCGQGGQFFVILCGYLLWTDPYYDVRRLIF